MRRRKHERVIQLLTLALWLWAAPNANADDPPARVDYLTFSQGAIAVGVNPEAAGRGIGLDKALAAIDGNRAKYGLGTKKVPRTGVTEFTYELPAPTVFDRFAVAEVSETPSPMQTFARTVEVWGSPVGATDGFVMLAKGDLRAPTEKGHDTELTVMARPAVRWIKLRLSGGIDDGPAEFFPEFSEIIGNGTQEPVPLVTKFHGKWKQRAAVLELVQDGPVVTGCYDRQGKLDGTVTGNVLRATGKDRSTGVRSVFVLTVSPAGEVRGVRSTNGAPFYSYDLPVAPPGTKSECAAPAAALLGCGAVIHGINFDFDSAQLRPDSEPVLARLFAGLSGDTRSEITIEGYTSSEGSDSYNRALSERRAQAVVDDLVRRGIDASRLRAVGKGEQEPIATNDDEAGRSLNRRVEVVCRNREG